MTATVGLVPIPGPPEGRTVRTGVEPGLGRVAGVRAWSARTGRSLSRVTVTLYCGVSAAGVRHPVSRRSG